MKEPRDLYQQFAIDPATYQKLVDASFFNRLSLDEVIATLALTLIDEDGRIRDYEPHKS
jgi:hypothetical protein